MERSGDLEEAWRRFCDRLSAGDVASFDDVVSPQAVVIIGTAPGEWVEDRVRMRYGFEAEGVRLDPGEPRGYAENGSRAADGAIGWVVDQPTFAFPDGSAIAPRVTAVLRREEGAWRLVHAHFSVGVPDEEVVALQERWSA